MGALTPSSSNWTGSLCEHLFMFSSCSSTGCGCHKELDALQGSPNGALFLQACISQTCKSIDSVFSFFCHEPIDLRRDGRKEVSVTAFCLALNEARKRRTTWQTFGNSCLLSRRSLSSDLNLKSDTLITAKSEAIRPTRF